MYDFDWIKDNVMNSIEDRVKFAYDRGFEDGRDECSFGKLRYKQGLNDAWECVRKIDMANPLLLKEIFGTFDISDIIQNYSAIEVIFKFKEYEKKLSEKENME